MASQLSTNHMARTIGDMKTGEYAYIVPWALLVDDQQQMWIREDYTVFPASGGTVEVKVLRGADGYHVELLPGLNFQWSQGTESAIRHFHMVRVASVTDSSSIR